MCDKCGTQFTEKRSHTKHIKTHAQSSQTYTCNICGKEFSRQNHKTLHEKSHDYIITCPVCGQYFNRREGMLRHRARQERPEVRPRMLVQRPASPKPGPSNSPAKTPRIHSPQSPNSRSVEPNILPENPETKILYLRHWNTIQTQENSRNRVQERYSFALNDIASSTFPEIARHTFTQQPTAFTINLSFGFMLRNVKTGELRYFHSSFNNNRYFDIPHRIRNVEDLERFIEEIARQDLLEYIRQQRPDTKWVVHLLTNVAFHINNINNHPIGAGVLLPAYVSNNPGLWTIQ